MRPNPGITASQSRPMVRLAAVQFPDCPSSNRELAIRNRRTRCSVTGYTLGLCLRQKHPLFLSVVRIHRILSVYAICTACDHQTLLTRTTSVDTEANPEREVLTVLGPVLHFLGISSPVSTPGQTTEAARLLTAFWAECVTMPPPEGTAFIGGSRRCPRSHFRITISPS